MFLLVCGSNSVVECLLPKQNVEGSNPFSRFFPKATYPSGKGAVCKTVIRQFESARRLRYLEYLEFDGTS